MVSVLSNLLSCLLAGVVLVIGWVSVPTVVLAQENTVDYTLTDLSFRDFSGQQLSGTSFAAAEMREANFAGADLSRTILTKASFLRANLAAVNLAETFADRVIFDEADLSNAIFTDAILTSSSFRDTKITGADFSGAIIDRYQIAQLCKVADGTNPITHTSTRDSLGCRSPLPN
jgi:uncharacterized protein YjbI with pentapeptide repeats